jgi:hypothetical protein
MEEVQMKPDDDPARVQYLPHHCVLRPSSTTTSLRVVFDASAKTTTGLSLNDIQHVGARVQQDLVPIMIRMRKHRYAMISDVTKMYRHIRMNEDHCNLQRILWMVNGELKAYRLNTVTYGTTSAPFLATRTLKQLALDEKKRFPKAAQVGLKDFYVDDLMTGSSTVQEAITIMKEVIALLNSAGMELRKWCSNHPDIVSQVPEEMRQKLVQFNEEDDSTVKALGMFWQPNTDNFLFRYRHTMMTKN